MTAEQATEVLTMAISQEVAARYGVFQRTPELAVCVGKIARWLTEPQRQGLMIMGLMGNGKTTVVNAIEKIIKVMDFNNTVTGKPVRLKVVSALDITRLALDDYNAYKLLCYSPLLAIDDYGIEPTEVKDYGNVMYPLDELLYTRYNEQSTTIITTNLTTDQLRHHCPERLYDRFKEMFQIVLFTNPSYRGQQHSAS